ncbi:MAG: sensor histidine kinase [Rhodoferax sp.]
MSDEPALPPSAPALAAPEASEREAALLAQLAQARQEMQHLLYAVSHDLRAPLRHVTSFSRLLQEEVGHSLPDEARGFLDNVVDAAQRMGAMLDALLALSRVGTAALSSQAVCLGQVLEEAQREAQARSGAQGVQWEPDTGLQHAWVQADAALLRQALVALLDNALKFSRGGAPSRVAMQARRQGAAWELCIHDNGVGLPAPAQTERLGFAFVRLHSAQQFEGLGMGLALARKALARMDATLALENRVGAGCTARLVLPAASLDNA